MKLRKTISTDAGMCGIWDFAHFPKVRDYDAWEAEFLEDEDILRHIKAGYFVPINIHSDGSFEIEVRVGRTGARESLSEREKRYLTVSSQAYLFRSKGQVCFGGYEAVSNKPAEDIGCFSVPRGDYALTVHMIGWDKESGSRDSRGNPAAGALPDFVVIANPIEDKEFKPYMSIETFT